MVDSFGSEKLVHLFDELTETQPGIPTAEYKKSLQRRGVDSSTAAETIDEIKKRLENIYGAGWSIYIAEGRYWSVCSYRPGSNLAFVYKNTVYGVYQTPAKKNSQ